MDYLLNPIIQLSATPLQPNDDVIKWKDCPKCKGRGWFLIEPFRSGGSNGAGGLGNMTQCLTCKETYEYFKIHGKLPEATAKEIMKIDRDPRIDPQPGDEVIARKRTRVVTSRIGDNIIYQVKEQINAHYKPCWITTWQDWCKNNKAEVVKSMILINGTKRSQRSLNEENTWTR